MAPPGVGDPARTFSKMLGADLPFNPPFEMDNRGKRGVVIDLARDEGRAIARELIDRADVFVTNVRQSALRRLGLDHETLLADCPRLVYAAIAGYGLEGPDAHKAAYDIAAFWARSGIAGLLTPPGGQPPFQRGGMGDHGAGLAAAAAVSAALFSRERGGRGQLVSTSLLRQGLYTISFDLASALRLGVSIQAAQRDSMPNPAVNVYRDAEGRWFWLVGLDGDRHWPPLARVIGRPEWIEDPRFATLRDRAVNARTLIAMLDEIFATRTRDEWGARFDAEPELWWAPVQSLDEVLADPQVHACGGFVEVPDGVGTTLLPATPVLFAGTPCAQRWMAPEPGQHTDEVLGELGRGDDDLARLRRDGVIG